MYRVFCAQAGRAAQVEWTLLQRSLLLVWLGGLMLLLAACSAAPEPVDPADIKVVLSSVPEVPTATSEATLRATVSGVKLSDDYRMMFDVRIDDKPELLEGRWEGEDVYTATYTFPTEGTYTLYLHLYADDLHLTKKAELEVK